MQNASPLQAALRENFASSPDVVSTTSESASASLSACNIVISKTEEPVRAPVPRSLTLHFAGAADLDRVEALFQPEIKSQIDPHGFVTPRNRAQLERQITRGSAAMLVDEQDNIRAFCLASDRNDQANPDDNFTEIGSVMCDVNGFRAPLSMIAALSLREQFKRELSGRIYSKVDRGNGASKAVFGRQLGWNVVECPDRARVLFDRAYPQSAPDDPKRQSRVWYHSNDNGNKRNLDILYSNLGTGCLTSKRGESIALDISAISEILISDIPAPEGSAP